MNINLLVNIYYKKRPIGAFIVRHQHIAVVQKIKEYAPRQKNAEGLSQYRYSLEMVSTLLTTGKVVCVILLNPSKATQYIADKSIQFIENVIYQ